MNKYKLFRTLHDAGGIHALTMAGIFLVNIGAWPLSLIMALLILWVGVAWYHEVVLADDPKADVGVDAVYRYVEAALFTGIFVFALLQGLPLLAGMMVLAIVGATGLGWLGDGMGHVRTVLKNKE
ncbi:hypothetical protein [Salipiger sp. PrR003]|uniref:hypothetical protein n=1 Tax=Salipiger sp. PrR003 TaxID=2706776 RepID=UPI0013DD5D51|nr:hypothetical protein [Salipiger sp. PrR003]NDV50573.1 hypothetical protein [Salipiger sp. PrR003]